MTHVCENESFMFVKMKLFVLINNKNNIRRLTFVKCYSVFL